ncbi:MAG: MFS transporter [Bacteroidales bacterium]|nr:MFS transporter [Bacteroidales bacterium]
MKKYKLINNISALVVFAIAWVTYLLTIEPTASFWDCGEFISCAHKLDVGHPPGAPFFMLAGKFASLFASDVTKVAMMVNALSATFSALTILFLFLSITHMAKKLVQNEDKTLTLAQTIAVMGAGAVGALAYTFSDTFWFSAVEGEVYAFSSLFTAVVFWAILKWEENFAGEHSDRWLVFIAYMMGLSIGVHLLNLLAIPAIVMVFYFKKYETTWKGVAGALLVSVLLLGAIMYGFIPGSIEVAGWFELLFVNGFGFGYNSGALVYFVLTTGILGWAIYETYSGESAQRMKLSVFCAIVILGVPFIGNSWLIPFFVICALIYWLFLRKDYSQRILHLTAVCLAMLFVGYSCYTVTIIRSLANPSMDQNGPNNVFALRSYLGREQYGESPLFYGQYYSAELKLETEGNYCVPVADETTVWRKDTVENGKAHYVPSVQKHYKYDSKFCTLFPRMWSAQPSHISEYKNWADIKGHTVQHDRCGRNITVTVPTFGENLRFFFNYQLNYMYWRYFMWNFSGRQNDIQGNGGIMDGNWITGFDFIDSAMYGDQTTLPEDYANNKGRNKYYMLPLLLGLIGIWYQLKKGKKGTESFTVTTLLFVLTGIAIVVYLNQTPLQPRERDYAYAGSFYAFCIWIGLGVLGIYRLLDTLLANKKLNTAKAIAASLLCLGVPALMAAENWDDHDRSNRRTCADFGYDYLMSCEPNAIIFTYGDNDTFPLWYMQEVEGVRTDVRVCNLSYLQTDWYIDQMKRQYYESMPLPIKAQRSVYAEGVRDYAQVNTAQSPVSGYERFADKVIDLNTAMKFYEGKSGENGPFMPTQYLYLPVDKEQVLKTGTVDAAEAAKIDSVIPITLGSRIMKNEYMILEMLNNNNWERPIYYAVTVGNECNLGLKPYMRNEGLARRITPIADSLGVNIEKMYDNMMHKFRWGNVSDPNVYLDENNLRMCGNMRRFFVQLADALVAKGDKKRAKEVLDHAMEVMPTTTVPSDYIITAVAEVYYKAGDNETADNLLQELGQKTLRNLEWYFALDSNKKAAARMQIQENMGILQNITFLARDYKRENMEETYLPAFENYYPKYVNLNK